MQASHLGWRRWPRSPLQWGEALRWGEGARGDGGVGLPSAGKRVVRCHAILAGGDGLGLPSGESHDVAALSGGKRARGATVVFASPRGGARGAPSCRLGRQRRPRPSLRGITRRGGRLRWGEGPRGNRGVHLPFGGRARCAVMPYRRAVTASAVPLGNCVQGGPLWWEEGASGNVGFGLPSRVRARCAVLPYWRATTVLAVPPGNCAAGRPSPVGRGCARRLRVRTPLTVTRAVHRYAISAGELRRLLHGRTVATSAG